MNYPEATAEQIAKFHDDGFLVVENVVPQPDIDELLKISERIIADRHALAKDWDWRKGEDQSKRAFRIVQCAVTRNFPWMQESELRRWSTRFASSLMKMDLNFWYDQFLGKPPGYGAPTPWHQDEAYWGRRLFDRGITCWMSFHDVNVDNGCMHFIRGAHKRGMIEHINPPEMASDLLVCDAPPGSEIVACPLKAGSVTFHHSKTPHMTPGNKTGKWRLTLAQHYAPPGFLGEGDPYAWRVHVNQQTNTRVRAIDGVVVG